MSTGLKSSKIGSMQSYCDEVLQREAAETLNVVFMNVQYLFLDRKSILHSTSTESKETLQRDGKYKNPNVFTS
jgi:hypothetical protein